MTIAFVLICRDKPGAAGLRANVRPAHLDYIEACAGSVWLAGPLLSEEGEPQGSLLIIAAESEAAARAFAENDPYSKNGLFESVEVRPFRFVKGKLLSGAPPQS